MSAVTSNPDAINAAVAQYVNSEPTEVKQETHSVPAQDRYVTLPGGLITPTGEVITEIEVRELNGRDEEAVSKARTVGKALVTIVERGIARVGGRTPNEMDLNSMLSGDRDYALLHIYSVTFGSEVVLTRTCPSCNESVDLEVDLEDDIEVRRLDSPNDRFFDVQISRGTASVELPTGITQKLLYESRDKSLAELNTILLANTVTSINNTPVLSAQQVLDLPIRDRRKISDEIALRNPGPQPQSIKKHCPLCGADMEVAISIAALFQS